MRVCYELEVYESIQMCTHLRMCLRTRPYAFTHVERGDDPSHVCGYTHVYTLIYTHVYAHVYKQVEAGRKVVDTRNSMLHI